jgi:hypothetical protein
MDIKELIESIIRDLTEDASISKIMLKAQAIASSLGVQEFKDWVRREQNGYKQGDIIPDYRKCSCSAKVNLTQGYKIINNYDVPIDAIPDEVAREVLSHICFSNPISEIEAMAGSKSSDGLLKEVAPAYAYVKVGEIFPYANVDMLWKLVNTSAASGIVEKVKSKMLDFFIELDNKMKMGIDFNQLESRKEVAQTMNQTINAGIYHAGSGNIVATNSTIGNTVTSANDDLVAIKDLIAKIRDSHELDGNCDAIEELDVIENELNNSTSNRKDIKKSLLFIKDVAVNMGSALVAQLITGAMGIL